MIADPVVDAQSDPPPPTEPPVTDTVVDGAPAVTEPPVTDTVAVEAATD